MSAKGIEMHRLQELVRLHRQGTGAREVARLLGMSPNTEREYRRALLAAGLLAGGVADLPDLGALKAAARQHKPRRVAEQEKSSIQDWEESISVMLSRGATPQAIYDCLRLQDEDFSGSRWAVKRLCRRLVEERGIRPQDVVIRVETPPGEVAQVDFGYVGKLYDREAGVVRKAWVFVMVLGYSRHLYAEVVFDQRVETWQRLHAAAFAAFGGVPAVLVPDNLKAAVLRAAFGPTEDPALNRSYVELARHYGFVIDPTPPRSPEKKGKVESGVKYVCRNFFKPRKPEDIHEANRELRLWTREIAGMRVHGTTGRKPLEVFEQEERAALRPLPPTPFVPVCWRRARVHRDCQVAFERRLYPVPWTLVGREVWVRATPSTVDVYADDERVATHSRNRRHDAGIPDAFLPPERAPLRHRSRAYWLERAEALDPEIAAYIQEVFDSDDVLSMLRPVQAMVTHLASFPRERAVRACRRASYFGSYSYGALKRILRQGLDYEPLPHEAAPAFGALEQPRFARKCFPPSPEESRQYH